MLIATQFIGFGTVQQRDGVARIPTMTGATTAGVTMSATSTFGAGNEAWRAGDKLFNIAPTGVNMWLSAVATNGNLNIDFGSALTIHSYDAMNNGSYQAGCTISWQFQGANAADYSDAVTLDTRTSITWGTTNTSADTQTFVISNPGHFRYYRFVTTARGGDYSGFGEVQLYT